MSLPIKDTPVLTGKDAKRFLDELDRNKFTRESKEELDRIHKNYEAFKKLEKNMPL